MPSHVSSVLPNALVSRIAISGLMLDLPLTTLVRVCRVTPRISAPAVTDRPSGSRHALRTMCPGCAGFFIGMSFSPSVVIDQFNVKCGGFFKTKHDAPVGPHCHRPKPLQVAFERVQTITGKIKRLWRSGLIQDGQNLLNRVHQIRPYPAPVAALIEPFQAPVLEAPNHQNTPKTVCCQVSGVNNNRATPI